MLKEYQITNFKAFSDPVKLPIKPITLIFGPNSSGKSSLIQSLLMLKQTIEESKDPNTALLPKGSLVNLGTFRDFIHNHEVDREFSFKITLPAPKNIEEALGIDQYDFDGFGHGHEGADLLNELIMSDFKEIGLAVYFCFDSETLDIIVSKFELFIGKNSEPAAIYEVGHDGKKSKRYNLEGNCYHEYWRLFHNFKEFERQWNSAAFMARFDEINNLRKCCTKHLDELIGKAKTATEFNRSADKTAFEEIRQNIDEIFSVCLATDDFLSLNEVRDLSDAIKDYCEDPTIEKERVLQALSCRYSEIAANEFSKVNCYRMVEDCEFNGFFKLANFLPEYLNGDNIYNAYQREESGDIGLLVLCGASLIRRFFPRVVFIGPLRDYPERLYLYGGSSPRHMDAFGRLAPDMLFADRKLLESVNNELTRFGIDYEIKISHLSEEVFSLNLQDKNTGINASISDVGLGISQLLPVIVQSKISIEKMIIIQQPEAQLHPALQAELGDLFIESALGERKNNFILETHSEHLILRIMRRMRETAEGDIMNGLKITPEDICILYVEPGKDKKGPVVYEIRLDDDGTLLDPWPGGFFEEGFRERFL